MNISKQKIKLFRSLEKKKQRDKQRLFVAEGHKLVIDLLTSFKCRYLVLSDKILFEKELLENVGEVIVIKDEELKSISFHKSPQGVFAVFEIPHISYSQSKISKQLSLFLDDIQDPGNLGTIVRLADWFGIENIFCSKNTVDVFNPKTIQATMGAIARVKIHYVDKVEFLKTISEKTEIYGTFLEGKNIYQNQFSPNGIIVMGNEGNGISEEVKPFIKHKISIPSVPKNIGTSESLNVGIATAIVVSEFNRTNFL